jgi:hypothetical protein
MSYSASGGYQVPEWCSSLSLASSVGPSGIVLAPTYLLLGGKECNLDIHWSDVRIASSGW